MKSVRVLVTLPLSLKCKLDGIRRQGYTASGYIRALLEKEFTEPKEAHTKRKVKYGTG